MTVGAHAPAAAESNTSPTQGVIDLHVHTSASDGEYSPTEIVQQALESGLLAIAITDHDTLGGIAEAQAAAQGTSLEIIPGVEISTDAPSSEVHVLGYFVDQGSASLNHWLQDFQDSRLDRARRILDRLSRLGLPLHLGRVEEVANGNSVGRPHIAEAMVERGYVASVQEAFDRFIGRNRLAYVPRRKVTPEEAIQLVREAHGVPVLAHPRLVQHLVPGLAARGLRGIEAYYAGYTPEDIADLLGLAHKHGLIATGGSDFHGENIRPTSRLGGVAVPLQALVDLRACFEESRP
ncbi:MAG TPA: PHP domain-containing protein [Anaerolineae bacterium]|nr:PHP domain-containing protein [Anaerolineae bacterium]